MIEICEYKTINLDELLPLYEAVGWTNYTNQPQMLQAAFENSLKIFVAYEDRQLIGLVRLVGDGHSVVFIQDLLVYPNQQRKGTGRRLLQSVFATYPSVYQMHLLTDNSSKTEAFYRSVGLRPVDEINCRAFTKH